MTAERFLVVDANVAVKWFVPEQLSGRAAVLLHSGQRLIAPDVMTAEFGSVMRKKLRLGEVQAVEAREAIASVVDLVELQPTVALLAESWDLTVRYDCSFYDALYVALAIREGCRVVTADRRLLNGMGTASRERFLVLADVV